MKTKLCYLFFMLTIFAGCKKDVVTDTLSFESPIPVYSDDVASVSLSTSYVGSKEIVIPVKFAGDAVLGQDYSVSSESFRIGGSNPIKKITITPLVYGSNKKVIMQLQAVDGFRLDKYPSVSFKLADKSGYLSFSSRSAVITGDTEVTVSVFDGQGNLKKTGTRAEVEINVDEAKSTAKEGTHFEFTTGKKVVFTPGTSDAKLSLRVLRHEAGKDLIVLKIKDNPRFSAGQDITMKIRILGNSEALLEGKWKIKELVTTKEKMKENWYTDDESYYNGFPVFNEKDSFTIDMVNSKFIPDFKSELKNYFIGESGMTACEESFYPVDKSGSRTKLMSFDFGRNLKVERYMFDNINRNFDIASQSEDKQGVVGLGIDENSDKQLELTLYILDYKPTSMLQFIVEAEMYGYPERGKQKNEKPVAHMSGVAIVAKFLKADK